ncbi:prepilin-type N-terminal cleavage/methylation domain-containing protein [Metabacillus idriensis]|uniref:type IV pilus modification PilV family protein n=1 Tax=Metabacillus idriensis TaxID=324768 RepID=UPI00174B42DC|nr:type II secretion system protein [Metabacillus idriensis]
MKKDCSKQSGFTLIEVLASIVILTIMFSVLSGFFVNSASYSNTFDKKLTAVQLSKSLLEKYQAEGFDIADNKIGLIPEKLSGEEIADKLGLTSEMFDTSYYEATVSFQNPDRIQTDKLIKITVTVSAKTGNKSASSELKGYIRK